MPWETEPRGACISVVAKKETALQNRAASTACARLPSSRYAGHQWWSVFKACHARATTGKKMAGCSAPASPSPHSGQ